MNVTVDVFSVSSIWDALVDIEGYIKKLERLETELPKALAEYGVERAKVYFHTAAYDILLDGTGISGMDIDVHYESDEDGCTIYADGREVAFIEFGAGVFFNGEESYLGERPPEIANIGEYGLGHGKHKAWAFKDGYTGDWVVTHGTPANNCLYFTARDIEDSVKETARSILNG